MDEATGTRPLWLDATAPPAAAPQEPPRRPRRRPRWPGRIALVAGILTPLVVSAGILAATDDAFLVGTVLAYAAIGTSGIAVLVGLVAAVGGWGRGAGITGIVLGLVANPLVLLHGLGLLGGQA